MTVAPAWWDRFWFAAGSAKNLAAARVVVSVHALWLLLSRDLAAGAALPDVFWDSVPRLTRWRYLLFPGHAQLETVLQWVAAAALVAVALGVRVRITGFLAALLLYHLAPLETFYWFPSPYYRGFEVSILALVVLAASPAAGTAAPDAAPREAWEYRWPLVLIQLFVAQIYFFSAYSKLYRVGWDWTSGENLRRWLLLFTQDDQVAVFTALGQWVAAHPTLCAVVGAGTILFELGFIVTVFWKRSRVVLVPMALLFHAGIFFAMNIVFLNTPQLLVFVDWEALSARRSARRRVAAGPA